MMNSANGERIIDVERKLIGTDYPSTKSSTAEETPRKMYLRRHLLCFLAISVFFVGICSTLHAGNALLPSIRAPKTPTVRDQQRFQELLKSVDSSSLHEVLHEKLDKYKHGVFREDKAAIAVVHQQAPDAATSLIELAKRQAPTNGSTSAPPVTSTVATTTEATSTLTTPITSSIITTEVSESSTGPTSVQITKESTLLSISQSTFISSSVVVTSSNVVIISSDHGTTAISTAKGSPSPTESPSSPSISTSPEQPSSTKSNSPTETSPSETSGSQSGSQSGSGSGSGSGSKSSSPSTSPTPSVTSFDIYTTTLPNGKPTTITETTVVPAGQPDQTAVGGASTKTNPAGSLQTNGASTIKLGGANGIVGMIAILVFGAL